MKKVDQEDAVVLLGPGKTKEKKSVLLRILAVIGIIAMFIAIAYAVYRFFAPNYLEDFEEDFEDDFDSYFDDESEEDQEVDDKE